MGQALSAAILSCSSSPQAIEVRTTIRNLKREADVRAMLKEGGAQTGDRLSFLAADLTNDAGWPEAVAGCDYVLHVASPFPSASPRTRTS